jgi:hypothetical protein
MTPKPKAAADGQTAPPQPEPSGLILTIKVLENGMIHGGCHHAAGKIMDIPKDAAEYLAKEGKAEILGTA